MLTKSVRYIAVSYAIFYNQIMGPLKIIEIFRSYRKGTLA